MSAELFVTSDLHLGHAMVAELRGFDSVETHDAQIISNLGRACPPGSRVVICGDISAGSPGGERHALHLLAVARDELRLTFDLVAGNHDGAHPLHRDSFKVQARWLETFATVQPFLRRKIAGHKVWLSHFPYFGGGDRGDVERYPETRLNDNGSDFLLHGHVHTDERWTARRSLHIGLDAWDLSPVPWHTVAHMICERAKEQEQ